MSNLFAELKRRNVVAHLAPAMSDTTAGPDAASARESRMSNFYCPMSDDVSNRTFDIGYSGIDIHPFI